MSKVPGTKHFITDSVLVIYRVILTTFLTNNRYFSFLKKYRGRQTSLVFSSNFQYFTPAGNFHCSPWSIPKCFGRQTCSSYIFSELNSFLVNFSTFFSSCVISNCHNCNI